MARGTVSDTSWRQVTRRRREGEGGRKADNQDCRAKRSTAIPAESIPQTNNRRRRRRQIARNCHRAIAGLPFSNRARKLLPALGIIKALPLYRRSRPGWDGYVVVPDLALVNPVFGSAATELTGDLPGIARMTRSLSLVSHADRNSVTGAR